MALLGADDIQGKQHSFIAGNHVYYVGGYYLIQRLAQNETIGLTCAPPDSKPPDLKPPDSRVPRFWSADLKPLTAPLIDARPSLIRSFPRTPL